MKRIERPPPPRHEWDHTASEMIAARSMLGSIYRCRQGIRRILMRAAQDLIAAPRQRRLTAGRTGAELSIRLELAFQSDDPPIAMNRISRAVKIAKRPAMLPIRLPPLSNPSRHPSEARVQSSSQERLDAKPPRYLLRQRNGTRHARRFDAE